MKNINFISPVPHAKKKEVRRWFILSSVLIGSMLVYILASFSAQLYLYYLLSPQLKQSNPDSTHAALMEKQKEKDHLYKIESDRRQKIEQYHTTPKNPLALLQAAVQRIGKTALQHCSITPQTIEFSYSSNTMQDTQKKLEQLKTIPELSLAQFLSVHRNNNTITSLVRAERSKKKSRS